MAFLAPPALPRPHDLQTAFQRSTRLAWTLAPRPECRRPARGRGRPRHEPRAAVVWQAVSGDLGKIHTLRQSIRDGEFIVGSWLNIPSQFVAQLIARQHVFDFLVVDLEHAPIPADVAAAMVGSIAAEGVAPIVRVAWNRPEYIKQALDLGAAGVVVPMVHTAEQARAAVAAAKYPPEGSRGAAGWLHAATFRMTPSEYYERANELVTVAVQIESREGAGNAEEIAAVPGVDIVFVGPKDLHAQLGKRPVSDSEEPEFLEVLERVVRACAAHGPAPGICAPNRPALEKRRADGFRFIAVGGDAAFLQDGVAKHAFPPFRYPDLRPDTP
eukprot:tig00000383_g24696.t1